MSFIEKLQKLLETIENTKASDVKKIYRRFLKRLPDISHLKNVVLFSIVASILILCLFAERFGSLDSYLPKNPVKGGVFEEGVVGNIEQLNPLFSQTNSAEASVTKLLFSGLVKEDGTRNYVPDMAEKWNVSSDGKTYTFNLKKNLFWSDGKKISADDVIFTINTIQSPDARSPLLSVWKDVNVAKTDDSTVVFKLPNSYASFISLVGVPIVPKHVLEMVPTRSLKASEFSLKPVSSGPYKLQEIKKIRDSQEVLLTENNLYYGKKPYIPKVTIKTYPDQKALTNGYIKREVKAVEKLPQIKIAEKEKYPKLKIYEAAIPESDVLIFNTRNGFGKDKAFRSAIAMAVDRARLIKNVYNDQAQAIYGAILPGFAGSNPKLKQKPDLAAAKVKLTDGGYKFEANGNLTKDGKRVSVRLLSSNNKFKSAEADEVVKILDQLGVDVKIEKYPMGALVQDHIRPRNFDLLLISQNLGADADIYPFWHSSGINDPGLNFSGFSSRLLDKYLEQARSQQDKNIRAEKYKAAIQVIWDESPAIYLAWPNYHYGVSSDVKGLKIGKLNDPTDRFWDISSWYLEAEQANK